MTEIIHQRNDGNPGASGIKPGTNDTLSVRYEKTLNPRTRLVVREQSVLSAETYHQAGLGVDYNLSKKLVFKSEASTSTRGTGWRTGLESKATSKVGAYATVGSGFSLDYDEKRYTAVAGASNDISASTTTFMEYNADYGERDSVRGKTLGVTHKASVSGRADVSISIERSEENSSVKGPYMMNVCRVSTNLSNLEYQPVMVEAQYRKQTGSISNTTLDYDIEAKRKIDNNLWLYGEYDFSHTKNNSTNLTELRYVKTIFGFALRPVCKDRLNLLGRVGRINEKRSLALNTLSNPYTTTTALSIEGIYQSTPHFSLREKYAYKEVTETVPQMPISVTKSRLWINGVKWMPGRRWAFGLDYRIRSQSLNLNHTNGFSLESGYNLNDNFTLGLGFNFSSYSDDEFADNKRSWKGFFFNLKGKI